MVMIRDCILFICVEIPQFLSRDRKVTSVSVSEPTCDHFESIYHQPAIVILPPVRTPLVPRRQEIGQDAAHDVDLTSDLTDAVAMTHNITPSVCFLLLVLTAALLYFCTESRCLEISPRAKELVLTAGSSLTITCSGSGDAAWEIKMDDVWYSLENQAHSGRQSDAAVQVSSAGGVLTLPKVTWKHTGVYQCVDRQTGESQEVAVFVPGESCYFIHDRISFG